MVKVLALDPGTNRTGYAVLEERSRRAVLVDHGVLRVKGRDLPSKLLGLHRDLEHLFGRHRPQDAAVEKPFVGRSARDAITLSAGRAVCLLAAAISGARVHDYAPAQVKQAVSGNGRASKETVQHMVKTILGLREAPPPDAADAIALGLCHLNRL
jgi:crossover junction endodeoxyribonuclease RuvC